MLIDPKLPFDREKATSYFNKLMSSGTRFEIKRHVPRTLRQNALLHLWFKVFSDFIGDPSVEDCKNDVKRILLGQRTVKSKLDGKVYFTNYETHKMTDREISDFMDRFKAWAMSEYGCYLPYYGDSGYDDMVSRYS